MTSAVLQRDSWWRESGYAAVAAVLFPLRALLAFQVPLFFVTLTAMLFRPPYGDLPDIDRVLFGMLVASVALQVLLRKRGLPFYAMSWPMIGLSAMAIFSALNQAYEPKIWSVIAAKFLVPFVLFHLAGLIFEDESSLRWLERFVLATLAYLTFIAIAFLMGADGLVFPRFILDSNLGFHTDRARGPFLQAVANGVTLNLLGLLAMHRCREGALPKVWGGVLLASLPIAILATKTRAVWLSFVISMSCLLFCSRETRTKRSWKWLVAAALGVGLSWIAAGDGGTITERVQESSAVEFRMAAYRAGWSMFLERPLAGWGINQLQSEVSRRIDGFHGEEFVAVHNTYFELLIEHGVLGFALYVWLISELVRLRRPPVRPTGRNYADTIQRVWPLLLGVYLVNATFVVMNYQFVNGLVFTLAGIVAARQRAGKASHAISTAEL